ncbi:MAG: PAS domain S-box protein [Gemmata sp.]
MSRHSVPLRVLLPGAVFLFALSLVATMLWVQWRAVRERHLTRVADGLRQRAAELKHDLDRAARNADPEQQADSIACTGLDPLSAGTALVGPDGRVLVATRAEWVGGAAAEVLPPYMAGPHAGPVRERVARDGDSDRLVATYPVDLDGTGRAETSGVLLFALDAGRPVAEARADVWQQFRLFAAGALGAVGLLGLLLNRLVSRRLAGLLATVERFGDGDLEARPEVRGTDEIGRLGAGLGVMADRLGAALRELRASEERFRTTFEQAAVGVAHVAPDGRFLRVNTRFASWLGYTSSELMALRFHDVSHPDDLTSDIQNRDRILSGSLQTHQIEKRYLRRDGTLLWASLTLALHRDAAGEPEYFISVVQDVSDRRKAEADLRQTAALLQTVADETPDAIFVKDREGRYLLFNQAAARFVGKPIAEVLGRDDTALFDPDSARYLMARDRQVMSGGVPEQEEDTITAAGVTRTYLSRKVPYRDESGGVIGVVGTAIDITERKRVEDQLRRSEQELADFFENASVALHWVGPDGTILRVNRAELDMLGYAREEYVGRHISEFHADPDVICDILRRLSAGETLRDLEAPLRCKDGSIKYGLINSNVLWAGAEFVHTRCLTRDVTEEKRAEAALRESAEQLRTLVENATEAIVLVDVDTRKFVSVNQSAELLYGLDRQQLCGVGPLELSPPHQPDGAPSAEAAASRMLAAFAGELQVFEWVHRNAQGVDFPCEVRLVRYPSAAGRLVRGCVTDITERKRAAAFAARQTALLEQIARGSPLAEVLAAVVALIEDELPNVLASVLLLDRDGQRLRLGAAPNMPTAYISAIDGISIGPAVGSCGTAAFTQRPVCVSDIDADPLWADFKALARTHGLRSCWSEPILSARGVAGATVLGTLAVYGRTPGPPPPRYTDVIERAGLLASIAIESHRTARELQETALQFRTVFQSVPVGLFVAGSTGRVVMANVLCASQFGYSHDEMIGRSVEQLVPEPLRTAHVRLRAQYTAAPTARVMGEGRELNAARKNGALFPVEIGLVPMTIGGEQQVLVAVSDISKRVEAERRTRESEARKAAILHSALDSIISIDHEGRVVDFNPAAEFTFGCPAASVIGRLFGDLFVPPAYREAHKRGMERFLRTGEGPALNRRLELPALRADGTEFPTELYITVIQTGDRPTFSAYLRDITDRKRAEQELRALNADLERRVTERTADLSRLVAILDASPDYIAIAADPNGPVMYINAALQHLGAARGLTRDQLALPLFHPPETVRLLNEVALPAAVRDGIWLGETEVIGPDGATRPVSQLIQVHRGADGAAQLFSTIMRDISKLKHLEHELLQGRDSLLRVNAELSKVSRLKDEFLASMSHELRTPLNGVLSLSESLHEGVYGPVNPVQAGALRDIEQSGRHLLALINDILDLSKVEAGQLTLDPVPVDVEALCQSALRLVKEMAQKKRHRVTLSVDGRIGLIVADPKRLKQVLVNLLSNAVKFTPDGGVIELDVTAGDDGRTVSFAVRDNGIGIRPDDVGLLFQPFQQIDSRLSREYSGTGLGLALVRQMAELHGGGVEVASAPGQGSRFTVTIPLRVPETGSGSIEAPPARVRKVLLVEDSPGDALQIERYLLEMNVQVITHPSAGGAADRARQERPDLVLLDLLLTDGDGWQVLAELKADESTRAIPVVVVSVFDDQTRCTALGAAAVLLKPVDRQTLRRTLGNAGTSSGHGHNSASPPPPEPNPTAPLVLIAEDNLLNARAIGDYLGSLGYRIEVAANGLQAIELAGEKHPALILMDIQMPQLDGLEATRRLRAQPATASVPIIAVTALAMPGDRERCLSAGACEYLTKPVSLHKLRELIERLLPQTAPVGKE